MEFTSQEDIATEISKTQEELARLYGSIETTQNTFLPSTMSEIKFLREYNNLLSVYHKYVDDSEDEDEARNDFVRLEFKRTFNYIEHAVENNGLDCAKAMLRAIKFICKANYTEALIFVNQEDA